MKVQLFASSALTLLSTFPGVLSVKHLHLKEGDLEEKKSFPARSITLRGAAAAAFASYYGEDEVSDYDEEDEDEELYDWERHVPKNPHTGKPWGSVENEWCYTILDEHWCGFAKDDCKWDTESDECTPKPNSSSDYDEDEVSEELYDEEDEDEKFYYYENEEWCNSIDDKRMCNFSGDECTWDWRYRKCNAVRSLASSDYGED